MRDERGCAAEHFSQTRLNGSPPPPGVCPSWLSHKARIVASGGHLRPVGHRMALRLTFLAFTGELYDLADDHLISKPDQERPPGRPVDPFKGHSMCFACIA